MFWPNLTQFPIVIQGIEETFQTKFNVSLIETRKKNGYILTCLSLRIYL